MNQLNYSPANGIALVEFETKTGKPQVVKVHEIHFPERIYSHRRQPQDEARAIDKTFVSQEILQKLAKTCQELCLTEIKQSEPTDSLSADYAFFVNFIPLGKQNFVRGELFLNRRLERKGKVREIFENLLALEKAASELR